MEGRRVGGGVEGWRGREWEAKRARGGREQVEGKGSETKTRDGGGGGKQHRKGRKR